MIAADDPRHGTPNGYNLGCREPCCAEPKRLYNSWRYKQAAYGRWNPLVDAEPVRAHLATLSAGGMGWQTAADAAGIPRATVSNILYRNPRRVRPSTAAAVLSVRLTLDTLRPQSRVPAVGTMRRARALAARGFNQQWQAERIGLTPQHFNAVIHGRHDRVSVAVAKATRALYDEWSMADPPQGWTADRCRRVAARRGWPPPLAWDDEDLDDPDATPRPGAARAHRGVDWSAVERACGGAKVRLSPADRVEVVRRLWGLNDNQIRYRAGIHARTVQRIRRAIEAEGEVA